MGDCSRAQQALQQESSSFLSWNLNCWWPKLLPVVILFLSFGSDEIAVYNGMCNTCLWCFFWCFVGFRPSTESTISSGRNDKLGRRLFDRDPYRTSGDVLGVPFAEPLSNQLQSMLMVVTSIKIEMMLLHKMYDVNTPWKMNMKPTAITHLERKIIWNKPPWGHVPAVNLQGCTCCEHTQMMSQHSVNFTKGGVLIFHGACYAQNCPLYSPMACNAFFFGSATFKCPREDFSTLETLEFPSKTKSLQYAIQI